MYHHVNHFSSNKIQTETKPSRAQFIQQPLPLSNFLLYTSSSSSSSSSQSLPASTYRSRWSITRRNRQTYPARVSQQLQHTRRPSSNYYESPQCSSSTFRTCAPPAARDGKRAEGKTRGCAMPFVELIVLSVLQRFGAIIYRRASRICVCSLVVPIFPSLSLAFFFSLSLLLSALLPSRLETRRFRNLWTERAFTRSRYYTPISPRAIVICSSYYWFTSDCRGIWLFRGSFNERRLSCSLYSRIQCAAAAAALGFIY